MTTLEQKEAKQQKRFLAGYRNLLLQGKWEHARVYANKFPQYEALAVQVFNGISTLTVKE